MYIRSTMSTIAPIRKTSTSASAADKTHSAYRRVRKAGSRLRRICSKAKAHLVRVVVIRFGL